MSNNRHFARSIGVSVLEPRDNPATFGVTNDTWDATTPNSLLWAITQANETPGEDVITLVTGLIGQGVPGKPPVITATSTVTITEAVKIETTLAGQRVTITGAGTEGQSALVVNLGLTRIPLPEPGGGSTTVNTAIPEGEIGPGAGDPNAPRVAKLIDLDFTECTAWDGGAITVKAGTLWIESAHFDKNTASGGLIAGRGGAIFVEAGAVLQVAGNVAFTENSTVGMGGAGGAIWAEGNAHIFNTGNSFTQNKSDDGGAIASLGVGILGVEKAQFVGNIAEAGGGAIWLTSTSPNQIPHVISLSTFKENRANGMNLGEGGGIYISAGRLWLRQSDFRDNFARMKGGGLYADNASVTIASGSFKDNMVEAANGLDGIGDAIYVGGKGIVDCVVADKSNPNDLGTTFDRSIVWIAKNGTFTWLTQPAMPATEAPREIREE